MKRKDAQFTIAFVCLVLSFMLTLQFKTIRKNSELNLELKRASDLQQELNNLKDKYDDVSKKLSKTEDKVNEYQEAASQSNKSINVIKKDLDEAGILAGLSTVKGPGVTVTLKDSTLKNPMPGTIDENQYVIHDSDMLLVINELRDAGAEAISLNDQRILATSEVRCAGTVISVNNTKVAAPFVVKAIGNPDYLESSLVFRGGAIDTLKYWGIEVNIKKDNNLIVPKYDGAINFKYATPAKWASLM